MCVCLCVRNCVCVCPLSRRAIAALQPATTAALLSAFSPAPVSSRHAITLSNETGENASQAASCKHTVPESITSLSLSLCVHGLLSLSLSPVHSSLYPDCPAQYVAARWMSVQGWREIGRQSYCHTVIGAKTWLMS